MTIARTNYTSSLPSSVTTATRTDSFEVDASADFLVVGVNTQDIGATYVSATYNGASMTQNSAGPSVQAGGAGRSLRSNIYYLVAPSTGINNGVITMSEAVSNGFRANYAAYSGVDQTTPEDDADWGGINSGVKVTLSLTASVDGDWLYCVGENESGTFDITNGWTMLYANSNTHGDSNAALSSGPITAEAGFAAGSARVIYNAILFKSAVAPTTIKTWNGIPYANIKTFNGIPIANVKTINGIA